MRKIAALMAAFLLAGCSARPAPAPLPEMRSSQADTAVAQKDVLPAVEIYYPPEGQTPKQVVEAYFEELYWSYCSMTDVDLSAILDTEQSLVSSSVIWTQKLTQRRRLLAEHQLCYVETEQFPYEIRFIAEEELQDVRLDYWSERRPEKEGDITLHFEIRGDKGRAYPPQMALNTQHTMRLRHIGGRWAITFLYFPGSYRRYLRANNQEVPSDEQALAELKEEFRKVESGHPVESEYDGAAAAAYALRHTESPNDAFYHIGDWMGNCANFTSQCIWAGFLRGYDPPSLSERVGMTQGWYAGEGGGSPAWENVERFWDYITADVEMSGRQLEGIAAVQPGDLIQTSSLVWQPDEDDGEDAQPEDRYNHSLIVVDAERLLLAQHSPGCFVYYSDMPGLTTRFIRPTQLIG